MDITKLVEVLRATLDPQQRETAEKQLNEVHKIVGFAPTLLQVIMGDTLDMPVRQAGVIYLKNLVIQFWADREPGEVTGEPVTALPFTIHEQDRAATREHLVEAVIQAPDPIRVQLSVIISNVLKHDFPGRWPAAPEKIGLYLQSDQANTWLGALICLYQLVKNYDYKKAAERAPLHAAMKSLLPLLLQRCSQLLPDVTEPAVLVQKQILKIFFALVQFCLPMDLIDKPTFTQWMELIGHVVNGNIPEQTNQVEEEERPQLVWWKVKKWALHILTRVFDRYGKPGNVSKEYNDFANWYIKSFSGGILQVLLKLLEQYRQKLYVAPRVLQLALNYINGAVGHAVSWKLLKPHFSTLVQDVLFPLMCHSPEDQELWEMDPIEYIRTKFDVFEDYVSPVMSAQTVLHTAATKRKECLQRTMGFVVQMLGTAGLSPQQKDGCLNMVGSVADLLVKRKIYKDQAEQMIMHYVFPEFASEHGFLRARACKVFQQFCEIRFKSEENLKTGVAGLQLLLTSDKELPVRVEAAMAVQMILTHQEKAVELLKPYIKNLMLELLKLIRETENDDLTTVLQKLVCTYDEDIAPFAVEMTQHLADTFAAVINSDDNERDDKAITAMGILNTIDSLLTVMEEQTEYMVQLETVVLRVVGVVLQNSVMEFYEEVLSLVYSLTCHHISQPMWQVFFLLHDLFIKDGFDYFTDMMPALHNYVTVDTDAFLANPRHLEIVFEMCKTVLTGDSGEDAECHAAKLLEVLILQCRAHIEQVIPTLVQLAMERLTKEVHTSELRTMCLQVAVAALYTCPGVLIGTLENAATQEGQPSLTLQFMQQWFKDADCFLGLHDRKVCVLGLATILSMPGERPRATQELSAQILPKALLLFSGLKRAYAARAEDEDSDDEEAEDGEAFEEGPLESDESDVDEDAAQYLERIERGADSDSDDEDDYLEEETALESYQTPLDVENCPVDEYIVFKEALLAVQAREPAWYAALTGVLTEDQQGQLRGVIETADKRRAQKESQQIEQSGGYNFINSMAVPSAFNFSNPAA